MNIVKVTLGSEQTGSRQTEQKQIGTKWKQRLVRNWREMTMGQDRTGSAGFHRQEDYWRSKVTDNSGVNMIQGHGQQWTNLHSRLEVKVD